MMKKTVADFVAGLCSIPEGDFTLERVASYLKAVAVDPASLEPYMHFTATHYTRNLIHRTENFELMAICWDVGQKSRIHNHAGQNCWMAAPLGRLVVQNYDVADSDDKGHCRLRETDRIVMDPERPAYVRPERPIHAVLNPVEHGERAVSLHVYSRPYDHCLVYSLESHTCQEVPLFFDTVGGKPVPATPLPGSE